MLKSHLNSVVLSCSVSFGCSPQINWPRPDISRALSLATFIPVLVMKPRKTASFCKNHNIDVHVSFNSGYSNFGMCVLIYTYSMGMLHINLQYITAVVVVVCLHLAWVNNGVVYVTCVWFHWQTDRSSRVSIEVMLRFWSCLALKPWQMQPISMTLDSLSIVTSPHACKVTKEHPVVTFISKSIDLYSP